jgi:hypothetical protein
MPRGTAFNSFDIDRSRDRPPRTPVIPMSCRERRKGFEPSTPSLGSWPRVLERHHGVLAVPLATRRDRSRGAPDTASCTFGMTFDERASRAQVRRGSQAAGNGFSAYGAT